ncbi:MAG: hypothetical protein HN341_08450 [Verrucomicrobia bacterium]|nr:hypothetical protein [Verrucomicrobiota bacterium]
MAIVSSLLMLSKVYVVKAARGHGFGKQVMRSVAYLCRQRGIKTIC